MPHLETPTTGPFPWAEQSMEQKRLSRGSDGAEDNGVTEEYPRSRQIQEFKCRDAAIKGFEEDGNGLPNQGQSEHGRGEDAHRDSKSISAPAAT